MEKTVDFKSGFLAMLDEIRKTEEDITSYPLSALTISYFEANCQRHHHVFTEERVRSEMRGVASRFYKLFKVEIDNHNIIDQFTFARLAIHAAFETGNTYQHVMDFVSFVVDIPHALQVSLPEMLDERVKSDGFVDDVAQIVRILQMCDSSSLSLPKKRLARKKSSV